MTHEGLHPSPKGCDTASHGQAKIVRQGQRLAHTGHVPDGTQIPGLGPFHGVSSM